MKDYSITLEDTTGRTVTLSISADCIAEQMAQGDTLEQATEAVETNAAENAIARGEISYPCYTVSTTTC
jgi:hypothetical protein